MEILDTGCSKRDTNSAACDEFPSAKLRINVDVNWGGGILLTREAMGLFGL